MLSPLYIASSLESRTAVGSARSHRQLVKTRGTQSSFVLRRPYFVALALVTIAAGLAVHFRGHAFGDAAQDIIGDALWAMMMVWCVGVLIPQSAMLLRGAIALAISFGVEFSQLIHTPALDSLRTSTVGHLVLGSGFDGRDLASYACGVVVAMLIERAMGWRSR